MSEHGFMLEPDFEVERDPNAPPLRGHRMVPACRVDEAVTAALTALRARVEGLPNAGGGHLDTTWNDAFGQMQHWHECASGSGLGRAAVLALIDAALGEEP